MGIGIHVPGKMEETRERFSESVGIKTVICDLDLFWLSEVKLTLRVETQSLSKAQALKIIIFKCAFLASPFCFLFSSGVKPEYPRFRRMRKKPISFSSSLAIFVVVSGAINGEASVPWHCIMPNKIFFPFECNCSLANNCSPE